MDPMEAGLAQQSAQQQQAMGNPEQMIQEVVQMLMQGADPDELLKRGVPMEILQAAIEIVLAQEQQAQGNQAPPATESGLAMMSAGM